MIKHILTFFFILSISLNIYCLKLDRVILATDLHPDYVNCWPMAAQAWKKIVGIKPTLAFIAPADAIIDETIGDVIRIEPIKGISTRVQAAAFRLLLPALFPDDICLTSDIDLIPLQNEYYCDSIKSIQNNEVFIIYRNKNYDPRRLRYVLSFNAGKGSVFGEIFHVNTLQSMINQLIEWNKLGFEVQTDELILYHYVNLWPKNQTNCIKLEHKSLLNHRIRKKNLLKGNYNLNLLKTDNFYIDAETPRPFLTHLNKIATVFQIAMEKLQC